MLYAILAVLVISLIIAAPAAVMADDGSDMPHMVLTIVCTIYTDQMDEAISSMDRILGTGIADQMNECTISTELVEAVVESSIMVDISEGSLFPVCANDDSCFVPHTTTVDVGVGVMWTNSDTVLHTVTEPSGLFDQWLLPGGEFSYTFEEPGIYAYGCVVHPWASGAVVVKGVDMETAESAMTEPVDQSGPAEIINLLEEFVAMYKTDGVESFAAINNMAQSPDPDVVGWVISPDYVVVAHSTSPPYVGFLVEPLLTKASIPINELAQAIVDAGMPIPLSYPFPDPQGNIFRYESAWVTGYDGYVFAARTTITPEFEVQGIVEEMIRQYNLDPDGVFESINRFMSQSPMYPFVTDPDTITVVAHGANPDRVGVQSVLLTNSTISLEEFRGLAEGEGVWAEYVFINPTTNMEQHKRSWVVMHDGYLFGSGYYP